eukprot:2392043-Rhodomonas_salina.1
MICLQGAGVGGSLRLSVTVNGLVGSSTHSNRFREAYSSISRCCNVHIHCSELFKNVSSVGNTTSALSIVAIQACHTSEGCSAPLHLFNMTTCSLMHIVNMSRGDPFVGSSATNQPHSGMQRILISSDLGTSDTSLAGRIDGSACEASSWLSDSTL